MKSRKEKKKLQKELALQRKAEFRAAKDAFRGCKTFSEGMAALRRADEVGANERVLLGISLFVNPMISSAEQEAELFDYLEHRGVMPKHHINSAGLPDYTEDETQLNIQRLGGYYPGQANGFKA